MRLFTPTFQVSHSVPIVAMFGSGLIGSAISAALQTSVALSENTLDLDWNQPKLFGEQLGAIEARIAGQLDLTPDQEVPTAVRVVWSAGKAGFQSTEEEASVEFVRFDEVVRCVERLADRFPSTSWTMILISSAGGLYEGQQHVGLRSVPTPMRPYSFLKLRQEERLQESVGVFAKKIYRPTSVYGYVRNHQRRGLIPTLIADGIRQRASQITGFATTLRDYVWIEDIADHVARVILDDDLCKRDSVEILGSAKPSSIFEIQHIVERILQRPLYLRFTTPSGNGDSTTFGTDVLPSNWSSSELETNVRKIAADAMIRQTVFTGAS